MFKPGMVCIFCDSCLDRKGSKNEYKETRREKQVNRENMKKKKARKKEGKELGKKERIKEHENKKTRLEHKRPTVSLHHFSKTDYHHLCLWSCTLCSTNTNCVTKAGAFQFLEDACKLSEQTIYPVK